MSHNSKLLLPKGQIPFKEKTHDKTISTIKIVNIYEICNLFFIFFLTRFPP